MGYIEGNLSDAQGIRFENHIEICPICRKSYSIEVEMTTVFNIEGSGAAGPDFVDNVMAAIDYELSYATSKANNKYYDPSWVSVISGALGIVLVAFLWFLIDGGYVGSLTVQNASASISSWWSSADGLFSGLYSSTSESLGIGLASASEQITQFSLLIGVLTGVFGLFCVGLITNIRQKLVKELRT